MIIICLCIVIWFQIFLFRTNNFQTDLFDTKMGSEQILPLLVSRSNDNESLLQISWTGASPSDKVYCHTKDTSFFFFYPFLFFLPLCRGYSQCILNFAYKAVRFLRFKSVEHETKLKEWGVDMVQWLMCWTVTL